uniref:Kazal-type serine peptidase inhibitor domain 3 n=1 Tax=Erpetoichthys calabaricus TaxID=27687 RepID=A0A8C4S848_ERPCA
MKIKMQSASAIKAMLLLTLLLSGVHTFPANVSSPSATSNPSLLALTAIDCPPCQPELCPLTPLCPAGWVLGRCGCCQECGNVEGQPCDLDPRGAFYGRCGRHLRCQLDPADLLHGNIPEPRCVCESQQVVCGSDGVTYENICRMEERTQHSVTVTSSGPCEAAPQIKLPPQNLVSVTGKDIIFHCEVFAFPMVTIEWWKDDHAESLPGDDPHISVQCRGGPMHYELSSWLQIETLRKHDTGIYHCVASNKFGRVMASANLTVVDEALHDLASLCFMQ